MPRRPVPLLCPLDIPACGCSFLLMLASSLFSRNYCLCAVGPRVRVLCLLPLSAVTIDACLYRAALISCHVDCPYFGSCCWSLLFYHHAIDCLVVGHPCLPFSVASGIPITVFLATDSYHFHVSIFLSASTRSAVRSFHLRVV